MVFATLVLLFGTIYSHSSLLFVHPCARRFSVQAFQPGQSLGDSVLLGLHVHSWCLYGTIHSYFLLSCFLAHPPATRLSKSFGSTNLIATVLDRTEVHPWSLYGTIHSAFLLPFVHPHVTRRLLKSFNPADFDLVAIYVLHGHRFILGVSSTPPAFPCLLVHHQAMRSFKSFNATNLIATVLLRTMVHPWVHMALLARLLRSPLSSFIRRRWDSVKSLKQTNTIAIVHIRTWLILGVYTLPASGYGIAQFQLQVIYSFSSISSRNDSTRSEKIDKQLGTKMPALLLSSSGSTFSRLHAMESLSCACRSMGLGLVTSWGTVGPVLAFDCRRSPSLVPPLSCTSTAIMHTTLFAIKKHWTSFRLRFWLFFFLDGCFRTYVLRAARDGVFLLWFRSMGIGPGCELGDGWALFCL
ncbi:hypothetical protein BDN72DRAFT_417287 [Pluteus cervinus]|uniref:Uncharacterized protein n=1 Tax=Pluteus cervinus TaxID=181527 RepID=A0ACD3B290_9AGAR|nr:hypothetical protein BDN72DRAFT_417287 [Pluteus cervinus]